MSSLSHIAVYRVFEEDKLGSVISQAHALKKSVLLTTKYPIVYSRLSNYARTLNLHVPCGSGYIHVHVQYINVMHILCDVITNHVYRKWSRGSVVVNFLTHVRPNVARCTK